MNHHPLRLAILGACAALALAACGSDSPSTATPTTAAPTTLAGTTVAPTTDAATTVAPTTVASSVVATGSAEQTAAALQPSIDAIVDMSRTPDAIAADIVDGKDLAPTVTQLFGVIKDFSITFVINDPTFTGDTAQADVQILSNGSPFPDLYPVFWQETDGEWHVARAGFCTLITAGGLACPE